MKTSARQAAFEILVKIERDNAYSNLTLDSVVKAYGFNSTDCAFISRLVYGVTERKLTLDSMCNRFMTGKVRCKPALRTVLRLGAYQLWYCDSVPESAAVNESVVLAKNNGCDYACGMVNAVLRKCAEVTPEPESGASDIEKMAFEASVPTDLAAFLSHHYTLEVARAFLLNALERPKTYIRVNTIKISCEELKERFRCEGIEATDTILPGCLLIENAGDPSKLAEFKDGLFHVQDLSSQLCVAALGIQKGDTVLDICAAPGGKSFTAAQYAGDDAKIISCDLYESRVGLIADGAKRLGLNSVKPTVRDAAVFYPEQELCDRVLCDVPCSGLGVIGRKPEIKYKPLDDAKTLFPVQKQIISTAARYVKPGGTLVYSTCSLNPHENRDICDSFLKENPDFSAVKVHPGLERREQDRDYLTLLPHIHNCDGFFIAEFQRTVNR